MSALRPSFFVSTPREGCDTSPPIVAQDDRIERGDHPLCCIRKEVRSSLPGSGEEDIRRSQRREDFGPKVGRVASSASEPKSVGREGVLAETIELRAHDWRAGERRFDEGYGGHADDDRCPIDRRRKV